MSKQGPKWTKMTVKLEAFWNWNQIKNRSIFGHSRAISAWHTGLEPTEQFIGNTRKAGNHVCKPNTACKYSQTVHNTHNLGPVSARSILWKIALSPNTNLLRSSWHMTKWLSHNWTKKINRSHEPRTTHRGWATDDFPKYKKLSKFCPCRNGALECELSLQLTVWCSSDCMYIKWKYSQNKALRAERVIQSLCASWAISEILLKLKSAPVFECCFVLDWNLSHLTKLRNVLSLILLPEFQGHEVWISHHVQYLQPN